jgi:D-tyrosyl-tRNA(Tyr) deacylase
MRSVLHKGRVRRLHVGGGSYATSTSTVCARSTTVADGMNIADRDEDVTCKLCLRAMAAAAKAAREAGDAQRAD